MKSCFFLHFLNRYKKKALSMLYWREKGRANKIKMYCWVFINFQACLCWNVRTFSLTLGIIAQYSPYTSTRQIALFSMVPIHTNPCHALRWKLIKFYSRKKKSMQNVKALKNATSAHNTHVFYTHWEEWCGWVLRSPEYSQLDLAVMVAIHTLIFFFYDKYILLLDFFLSVVWMCLNNIPNPTPPQHGLGVINSTNECEVHLPTITWCFHHAAC